MNSFGDAITESGTGVILAIEVSPASGREEFFSGYDPWRKEHPLLGEIPARPWEGEP